jgi:tRNA pseudouridine13 synthase
MDELPYVTGPLPGTGGVIKSKPEDFFVEETPLYEPSGQGEHVYICVEKTGITTESLIARARRVFNVPQRDVGVAGLKDKWATARQVISVRGLRESDARKLESDTIRVLWTKRHQNKLRVGHLAGNNFRVLIRAVGFQAAERARVVVAALGHYGLANYFGEQRFGATGHNYLRGRARLLRANRLRNAREDRFAIQAYQSYLFNSYLAARIREGSFAALLLGDVAVKHATGGLFVVEDLDQERPRLEAFEISPTGPIFGYHMFQSRGEARHLEEALLESEGLRFETFDDPALKRAKIYGARRPLRIPLREVRLEATPEGLSVEFFLPKGSYATVLLREIMKSEKA